MKALRTVASALAILVGAAFVVAWCASLLVLKSVDDGVVARTLVRAALASPAVTAKIGDEVQSRTTSSLASSGIDVSALGIETQLRDVIDAMSTSDDFKRIVLAQVDAAHERLREELALRDRPQGPFVVSVNVSGAVNDHLGELPVIGADLPEVAVAPVDVELVSARTFDKVRTGYSSLEFAKRWFLWVGLAFIGIGLLVSTRRAFVIPKFVMAMGGIALALAAVLFVVTPERLAAHLPGGESGTWGTVVSDSIANDSIPGARRTLAIAGAVALVIGGLFLLLVRAVGPKRH